MSYFGYGNNSTYAYKPRKTPEQEMAHYRAGYPGDKGLSNPRATKNLSFFKGVGRQLPNGFTVVMFHPGGKFWGDYKSLESMHNYIQWLFPIHERSAFNPDSQALMRQEAAAIRADPVCCANLVLNYRCYLDFIGFELVDEATGELRRRPDGQWETRFANLDLHSHNNLRITRILKCLGSCGFERFKAPLIRALMHAVYTERTMPSLRGALEDYWVHTIMDDDERDAMVERVDACKAYIMNPVFCLPSDMPHLTARIMGSKSDEGALVDVWWSLDSAWYRGKVTRFSSFSAVHTVEYEDGDVRDHMLMSFGESCSVLPMVPMEEAEAYLTAHGGVRVPPPPTAPPADAEASGGGAATPPLPPIAIISIVAGAEGGADAAAAAPTAVVRCASLDATMQDDAAAAGGAGGGGDDGDEEDDASPRATILPLVPPFPAGTMILGKFNNGLSYPGTVGMKGFDAKTNSYHVVFEDGDDHPNFRAFDVKQDLAAPVKVNTFYFI